MPLYGCGELLARDPETRVNGVHREREGGGSLGRRTSVDLDEDEDGGPFERQLRERTKDDLPLFVFHRRLFGIGCTIHAIILFGGAPLADTPGVTPHDNSAWVYDGTTWTEWKGPEIPEGRQHPKLASAGGRAFLYGGSAFQGVGVLSDMWVFTPPAP